MQIDAHSLCNLYSTYLHSMHGIIIPHHNCVLFHSYIIPLHLLFLTSLSPISTVLISFKCCSHPLQQKQEEEKVFINFLLFFFPLRFWIESVTHIFSVKYFIACVFGNNFPHLMGFRNCCWRCQSRKSWNCENVERRRRREMEKQKEKKL